LTCGSGKSLIVKESIQKELKIGKLRKKKIENSLGNWRKTITGIIKAMKNKIKIPGKYKPLTEDNLNKIDELIKSNHWNPIRENQFMKRYNEYKFWTITKGRKPNRNKIPSEHRTNDEKIEHSLAEWAKSNKETILAMNNKKKYQMVVGD